MKQWNVKKIKKQIKNFLPRAIFISLSVIVVMIVVFNAQNTTTAVNSI